ncbi:MAG: hypothetical protein RIS76_827, partial [Verrucomicrobiota bacterium]
MLPMVTMNVNWRRESGCRLRQFADSMGRNST